MKYLVVNLKNKLMKSDVTKYSLKLEGFKTKNTELVIVPSTIYISSFKKSYYKLGTQNISSIIDHTVTGEVTGEQLKSCGVEYALVGHSERRLFKHEINIDFINEINHAVENNIKVIYCIGESLKERENGDTYQVLEKQISEVLNNVETKSLLIAYEPVWAIGSGVIPTNSEITETILFIKDVCEENYNINIKVLYGGSVNEENIKSLLNIKVLDGFLVGSAGLNVDSVEKMINLMDN
ncbi:MAG: triose-phosphate isomerase family protein [Bacilli bacterium]